MKEPDSLEIYFNDHLAGATGAIELIKRGLDQNAGRPLEQFFQRLLDDVEQDKEVLEGLMDRLGLATNPLKQAGAWIGQKLAGLKLGSEAVEFTNFLTLEALSLGVEGKACGWRALKEVAASHEALSDTDFDTLLERAQDQSSRLEQQRLALAQAALATPASV
jgi:hypothetical protein